MTEQIKMNPEYENATIIDLDSTTQEDNLLQSVEVAFDAPQENSENKPRIVRITTTLSPNTYLTGYRIHTFIYL